MMVYFIIGGAASFLIVLSLIVILFHMLRINWNHANRMRLSYLAPVFVVILIVYLSMTELVPRALDLISGATRQFEMAEIELSEALFLRNRIVIGDRIYYFKPGTFDKGEKGRCQIAYTPRMRYIVNVTRLGDHSAE